MLKLEFMPKYFGFFYLMLSSIIQFFAESKIIGILFEMCHSENTQKRLIIMHVKNCSLNNSKQILVYFRSNHIHKEIT